MLVVTPFHPGDADQALRLFRWIAELGLPPTHDLLLIADTRCSPVEIETAAKQSFRTVKTLPFADHFQSWPAAPNACFAMAARHIMANQKVPWLFLEPDCVPLKAGWLDAIEAEYKAAGKPFMGARVEVEGIPLHLSGNAVYPADMFLAGNALIANDVAWDMVAAEQIVPQAHFTKLIEHSWRRDPVTKEPSRVTFATWEQVEAEVSKEAVIYHASKDGSLVQRLRERKDLSERGNESIHRRVNTVDPDEQRHQGVSAEGISDTQNSRARSGNSSHCDILIKSYPPDFERLGYCLRSIEKFANGFRRVLLAIPKGEYAPVDHFLGVPHSTDVQIIELEEHGEPYLFQQTIKANAHEYSDADYFLHLDSDCLLTRSITPETFFRDGKVLWLMTPYASIQAGIDAAKAADPNFYCGSMTWKIITEKFLGEPVEFEFMRRMPMFTPRSLHVAAAEFCKLKHGQTLSEYILSQPAKEFSEFNALGALAYSRARDDFYWLDTTKEPLPESVCIQKWSHEPFSAETKTEFEAILNASRVRDGGNASAELSDNGGLSQGTPTMQGVTAGETATTPWHSTDESKSEVQRLANRLRDFCTTPVRTRQVRSALHDAGVIELSYRYKRRKGKWRKRKART